VPRTPRAALVAATLALTACGAGAAPPPAAVQPPAPSPDPASSPAPDPASSPSPDASPARPAGEEQAVEITLEIPVGRLPDGTDGAVTVRAVTAGERRELVVDTPAGVVDRHVMTDDEHWWWITPAAREVVDVEWIHIDLREVEAIGGDLPGPVADARAMLPAPGEVEVGTVLGGREVRAVDRVGPDEDRVVVAGLDEPVVLRRRVLREPVTIEPPREATSLRELADRFGG